MLSLYRAWLPPLAGWPRPAPPPGAHRPIPRRARPPRSPSPTASDCSELDVVELSESPPAPDAAGDGAPTQGAATAASTVLDIACCDGPVKFSRVLNESWRGEEAAAGGAGGPRGPRKVSEPAQYYPCKSCGSRFPSYYFVHKHRKRCHPEEEPSTSSHAAPLSV